MLRRARRVEGFLDSTKVRTCPVSFPWLIRFLVVTLYRRTAIARIEFVTQQPTVKKSILCPQLRRLGKVTPFPTGNHVPAHDFQNFLSHAQDLADRSGRHRLWAGQRTRRGDESAAEVSCATADHVEDRLASRPYYKQAYLRWYLAVKGWLGKGLTNYDGEGIQGILG